MQHGNVITAAIDLQEAQLPQRYPNVTGSCTPLRLTPLAEGFPWDDLGNILHGGPTMAKPKVQMAKK